MVLTLSIMYRLVKTEIIEVYSTYKVECHPLHRVHTSDPCLWDAMCCRPQSSRQSNTSVP